MLKLVYSTFQEEKMKKGFVILFVLLLALSSVFAGAQTETKSTGGIKQELIIGTDENVTTLDPQGSNSRPNLSLYCLTHNLLIKDDGTGGFACDLAESYEQKSDLVWVFHLHKGVKFHNGEELKASDVVFTLNRALGSSFTADYVSHIDKVEASGDYDVVLTLKDNCQDILFFLKNGTLSILNEKAVKADSEKGVAIGTGPYVLREWILNDHTTVVRFADYWGEQPKTEIITFRIIPEASARLISLQTGEIDVCLFPASIDLNTIRNSKDVDLLERGGDTMNYVTFNTTRKPFDNADVRRAIAYAINRKQVIEVAAEGNGTEAYTFFSPGYGLTEDLEHYDYNPEKAKELLASAGYNAGNPLKITMICSGNDKELQAQVIQQNLKDVGVQMTIETMEKTVLKQKFKEADYDISLYNWANEYLGPDTNCRPLLGTGSGSNRSHFADSYFDELINKAIVENDNEKRLALYAEAQRYAIGLVPIMPLFYEDVHVGATKKLKGFTPDISEVHNFATAYVEL